jgi:plastocyanin
MLDRHRQDRPVRHRRTALAGAALLLLGGAATGALAEEPTSPTGSPGVVMAGSRFLPGDSCLLREGGTCVRLTEPVTVARGSSLKATNLDLPRHDIRSDALDPKTNRPRFSSALLAFGATGEVTGVDRLEPGSYSYYCSLHPPAADGTGMRGVLRVVEGGTP